MGEIEEAGQSHEVMAAGHVLQLRNQIRHVLDLVPADGRRRAARLSVRASVVWQTPSPIPFEQP